METKSVWESEKNLLKYFFTCPNMTNLIGKIHKRRRASSSWK